MKRLSMISVVVALCSMAIAVGSATPAHAQCNTCATPVVAYSPVVAAAPVVAYEPYRGWYPGKLLDTWRMRRWGYTAPTTVTAAYAPYTAGYAPYTAAYAPYTAAYAPTYTAPAYTTTNYATPYVTAYAPLGQRQVFMQPTVVQSPVIAATFADAGCSTCAAPSPCSTCSACEPAAPCSSCAAGTTVVEQATFATTVPAAPCTGCAQGSSVTYADSAPAPTSQTPQPALTEQEAAPLRSNYPATTTPAPHPQTPDPGPAAEVKPSDSSTYLEPPALFIPGDRTAQQETAKPVNRAPSVNVWNAVYREPVNADSVSTSMGQSQAEIDAAGWSSVPTN